jgi:transcriptional regulator with XRE-family HTH domain
MARRAKSGNGDGDAGRRVKPVLTSASMRLGGHLKKIRKEAGLSQALFGRRIGCSQSKINKLEDGTSGLKDEDLATIVAEFGVSAELHEELKALQGEDREGRARPGQRAMLTVARAGESIPEHFRRFTELEHRAETEQAWYAEGIPGILQSEQYMIAQFTAGGITEQALAEYVRDRNQRKDLLLSEDSTRFQILLGEAAFHRVPGGYQPAVLLDQLEHLITLMDTDNRLMLNIVPFSAALPHVPSDFTIMTFNDGSPPFIYLEHPGGSVQLEDVKRETLDRFVVAWLDLHNAAYTPVQSREFFVNRREEVRSDMGLS